MRTPALLIADHSQGSEPNETVVEPYGRWHQMRERLILRSRRIHTHVSEPCLVWSHDQVPWSVTHIIRPTYEIRVSTESR